VRHVDLIRTSEQPRFDSRPKRSLQEELEQRRRVGDDLAESRSSRRIAAAGVFNATRFRL
jgi:hypothetical protein